MVRKYSWLSNHLSRNLVLFMHIGDQGELLLLTVSELKCKFKLMGIKWKLYLIPYREEGGAQPMLNG